MSKDTIYRQDAINVLEKLSACEEYGVEVGTDEETYIGKYEAITAISDLPSADRPQGEWLKFGLGRGTRILFCTNCERRIEVPLSQGDSNYDFCPNCGARMFAKDINAPNKKGTDND